MTVPTGPRPVAEDRDPWERQPRERTSQYALFLAYRDQGRKRTVKGVRNVIPGTALQTIYENSSRWRWRERALAWDDHCQKIVDADQIEAERAAVKEMQQRHLKIAQSMQRVVSVEVARYMRQAGADVAQPDLDRAPILSFESVRRGAEYSLGLETKIRGVPGYGWEEIDEDDTMQIEGGVQVEMFTEQKAAAEQRFRAKENKQLEEFQSDSIIEEPPESDTPNATAADLRPKEWAHLEDE